MGDLGVGIRKQNRERILSSLWGCPESKEKVGEEEVHSQKQGGVRRLGPQGRCRDTKQAGGKGSWCLGSSFCRTWDRRSKIPWHHILIDLSSFSSPRAKDPRETTASPGGPAPCQARGSDSGSSWPRVRLALFLCPLSGTVFSPLLSESLIDCSKWTPLPTVSSTPRAACISSDVASVFSPPPGALGFLHFKYLTAGWTSASARRRTLCFPQWSASGTGAIFSPAVREAFSNDWEKLLSSCGVSPSRRALHFNQRPLTASFVGWRRCTSSPSLQSILRGLPLARAGERRTDITAGVPSMAPSSARSILVPSGVPTHVCSLIQL